jgi:hypothetical protein
MLSDAQIEEIAQAALDALGGDAQGKDNSPPSESGEQREARIARRIATPLEREVGIAGGIVAV